MNMRSLLCGVLSATLIIATTPVHADMIGTDQILSQQENAANLAQVQTFMARDEVRSKMEALGVDAGEAAQRIAALTDSELQTLAQNIQNMPAGGDSGLGILLTLIVILIILELLGAINIFPRI
jgi:predicted glycosyl hydrolase (DUF1957 family)